MVSVPVVMSKWIRDVAWSWSRMARPELSHQHQKIWECSSEGTSGGRSPSRSLRNCSQNELFWKSWNWTSSKSAGNDHRIPKWFRLEETLKTTQFTPYRGQAHLPLTRLLKLLTLFETLLEGSHFGQNLDTLLNCSKPGCCQPPGGDFIPWDSSA